MKIKAVATDIDATITDEKRRICINAIDALRKVEEKGINVMLVSGNVLPVAYALSIFIGTSGPIIAENGGVVFYNKKTFAFGKRNMRAYNFLKKKLKVKRLFTDRWRETAIAIEENVELEEIRRILSNWNLEVYSTGYGIHIMPRAINKWYGLKFGCKLLKIKPEEVLAFGDSDADIEMLKNCGVGIAVGNANIRLKKIAQHVVFGKYGNGVVEGLKKYGII
ncbi:MAG: phosphoglycolate phosphatase [Candidatus Thermoplasmatota archaeon]